jgi:LAS superfamily LD-carboxypeptidase LdcB
MVDVDRCRLLPRVAEAWIAMREAAWVDGLTLGTSGCYRSLGEQHAVYEAWCSAGECAMAAAPGTSTHGYAIAVDVALDGRTIGFASPEFTWMIERGPEFGFYHPDWAGIWSPTPEPWHFEFLLPIE